MENRIPALFKAMTEADNITAQEWADALGINKRNVQRWKNGKVPPVGHVKLEEAYRDIMKARGNLNEIAGTGYSHYRVNNGR